ncbi:unnamed protein product [Echinostoma caproni]|uniref:Uncharacterized protein n=1 Tax=Echinostoma caproni TaxID=27848 RepID=A0A3P8H7U0_9TREM|nr:unnamed protein product [Echinostoma caproni]
MRDTSRIEPSPILPPRRQRPVTRAPDPQLATVCSMSNQSPEPSNTVTTSRPTIHPTSQSPSPLAPDISLRLTNPLSPVGTPAAPSPSNNPYSLVAPQPAFPIQLSPEVPRREGSAVSIVLSPLEPRPSLSLMDPEPTSDHSAVHLPVEHIHSAPSPTEPPVDVPNKQPESREKTEVDPNSPVAHQPDVNLDHNSERRVLPKRQAQLNAKPILDLSITRLLDLTEHHSAQKPRTKRRRRLVHADDDDDENDCQDTSDKRKTAVSEKGASTTKGIQQKKTAITATSSKPRETQRREEHQSHGVGRVVEVQISKPGRVAFRADTKHALCASAGTSAQSGKHNPPSRVTKDGEFVKPSLRQRELAKKEAQRTESSKPTTILTQNTRPRQHITPAGAEKSPSVVLSPLKSVHGKVVAHATAPRATSMESNQDQNNRSYRRRRLMYDDDEDEGKENESAKNPDINHKSVAKAAKLLASPVDSAHSSKAGSTRTRSKVSDSLLLVQFDVSG